MLHREPAAPLPSQLPGRLWEALAWKKAIFHNLKGRKAENSLSLPPHSRAAVAMRRAQPGARRVCFPAGMKLSMPRTGVSGRQRECPGAFPVQSPELGVPRSCPRSRELQGTRGELQRAWIQLWPFTSLWGLSSVGTELQRLPGQEMQSQRGQGWKTPLRSPSPAKNTKPAQAGLSLARRSPHKGFLPSAVRGTQSHERCSPRTDLTSWTSNKGLDGLMLSPTRPLEGPAGCSQPVLGVT